MIESIRSLFHHNNREEKTLTRETGRIAYRLSILNSETIEDEAETLKGKGLNVEVVKEPRVHLVVRPLNPRDPSENPKILGYKVYLNPALGMTYVRQIREGFPEDVKYGGMSELESSIRNDLRHLRNASKKK